jgi:hypothetical protein
MELSRYEPDGENRRDDHGHGPWPSLSVRDRISHREDFIFLIIARKDEVVKTLMWEIGKPYGDSAKEFGRTVAYMRATIDALKDLDRISSRFVSGIPHKIALRITPPPLVGGVGGMSWDDSQEFHPHPGPPPSRGREKRPYYLSNIILGPGMRCKGRNNWGALRTLPG